MTLIEELGPATLHPAERQAVRDAADALLFSPDVASDADARDALDHLDDVVEVLVATERIEPRTGESLLQAVELCGPHTEPLALPAGV